jgi:virulence-associated protein VapD
MDNISKKGIHFDLDTDALKQYYPNGDWHNAYHEVRRYFAKNGFDHIQGSGYHSVNPISQATRTMGEWKKEIAQRSRIENTKNPADTAKKEEKLETKEAFRM